MFVKRMFHCTPTGFVRKLVHVSMLIIFFQKVQKVIKKVVKKVVNKSRKNVIKKVEKKSHQKKLSIKLL
jgi:hypothetical protein